MPEMPMPLAAPAPAGYARDTMTATGTTPETPLPMA